MAVLICFLRASEGMGGNFPGVTDGTGIAQTPVPISSYQRLCWCARRRSGYKGGAVIGSAPVVIAFIKRPFGALVTAAGAPLADRGRAPRPNGIILQQRSSNDNLFPPPLPASSRPLLCVLISFSTQPN